VEHDEDVFLAFLPESPNSTVARAVEDEVSRLGLARAWSLGPPTVVDVTDPGGDLGPDDVASPPTLGVALSVPSAQASTDSADAARQALSDCEAFLDAVAQLSGSLGLTFDVEMNGELIGSITGGRLDRGLTQGLLEPWREVAHGAAR
jgi:hypothetical protein